MPGAGHIIGANAIYASKPDGLTIGTFNTGLIYNQLVGVDALKADLTKMSWIGKAATDPRAIVISANSPISVPGPTVTSLPSDSVPGSSRSEPS